MTTPPPDVAKCKLCGHPMPEHFRRAAEDIKEWFRKLSEECERADRKVLGTPVITADGAYAFKGARVVCPRGHEGAKVLGTHAWCGEGNCWDDGCQGDSGSGSTYPVGECFSTIESHKEKT